ncbi:hypothetical protein Dsin_006081 [Dipteronia sinensis]|uniref:Uncharacterized protein n=1 Tax=Dipteronia sinensis TaxID=43782 RepID=A0AAE0AZ51_9ROSI|nr:hypothetical protein Dsin_006081 [Dipteronia sinensis]
MPLSPNPPHLSLSPHLGRSRRRCCRPRSPTMSSGIGQEIQGDQQRKIVRKRAGKQHLQVKKYTKRKLRLSKVSSRIMIISKWLADNVADEARMLDEYLEKQRRFEHEVIEV